MLYGDDPFIRYSYPDMIEQDDRIYITETNKYMARVHKIDPKFLKKIFNFSNTQSVADEGLLVDITRTGKNPAKIEIHSLPKFLLRNLDAFDYSVMNTRNGITLDFCVNLTSLRPGQNLLDNRTSCGRGFCITVGEQENIRLTMNDGLSESCWSSEPGVLRQDHLHHISVIIDSGPKIITALVDGKFCDGGDDRQFGWGRFSSELRHINGSEELVVGKDVDGCITTLRIYNRALMSTEAVGNYRATLKNT
jgi:hypothetical protein